ncbi:Vegetative incompatibility protein HET-E-1 [Gracilariopsis chorda]|uniref:Vegetative incompatibility protein HET-E-1 n=1 Tax=Gracilariopsis chorda TaxID=448386 RepID=A0A2V3ICP6_9FLOR|nr:Vegetative incompatibility protein HET-E-1 [Gracilariopsis chorda]|eukprot:PXF39808.1 Vegetative incompatibility protein HET-E-1 [Gracilariopsis chorda]
MDVATGIAAAASVVKVLSELDKLVGRLVVRSNVAQDNAETLHRLDQLYKDAANVLQAPEHIPSTNFIITDRLGHFETLLQQNAEKLEEWRTSVETGTFMNRVQRMKQILDKCEKDATEFYQFLMEHVSPAINEEDNAQPGIYARDNNVPRNPPRLTQDYDNPNTCEGRLRASILDPSSRQVIAVVASGKGGVGKTCAMRGLAWEPRIRERFSGGTLYIQLGNDSDISTVIKGIARVVDRTGNASLAKTIARIRLLQDAADKASNWFRPHTCLLLIDDIWWENGIDIEVLRVLCQMLNEESRIVFTSRDRRFLEGADSEIEFKETEARSVLARRMLMTHAGFEGGTELGEKNEAAVGAILDMCQGLPLALGIAGASVRSILGTKRADQGQDAWSDFHEDLLSKRKNLLNTSHEKNKLPNIVDISLEVLEKSSDGRSYQQLFKALCVIQKQQTVPIRMLQKLWDLNQIDEAKEVVQKFCTVSIVQKCTDGSTCIQLHDLILDIAVDRASEQFETQKYFRTLVCNYIPSEERMNAPSNDPETTEEQDTGVCVGKISKRMILQLFCCMPGPGSDTEPVDSTRVDTHPVSVFQKWWDTADDAYLHDNLCRVLREAGYANELIWLLSKPQWIVMRLLHGGIYAVEQDLEHGKAIARYKAPKEEKMLKFLEAVGKAARMSCTFVEDNPYEVWFQMYGRLVWYAKGCNRTQTFIDELEQCARKPWAKPSERFLQPAGGPGMGLVSCPGTVLCASEHDDRLVFLWYTDSENVCVTRYNPKTGVRSTHKLRSEEGTARFSGYTQSAAFSSDRKKVSTGHETGKTVIWDLQTGFMERVLDGHTGAVWCVAFSADSTRVVSGSQDRTVRLWDARSGEAVAQALVGHTGAVWCVAFSADGTRVVSGSDDRTVRLWDARSGEAVAQALVGHTGAVWCVAFSADGTRVVSGSYDGTVRLWDVRSGEAVAQALVGHTDAVMCVAFSADGTRVVSGSYDRTVRLWDARSGEAVAQALVGHTGAVWCVAFSADGTRVVSGSYDGTVRLWDARSGEAVAQALVGHTSAVWCVAFSADGTRMVSGSQDRTVRLWDVRSGEAQALVGHTGAVWCVAFSADGTRVVSGSLDCTVRLWDARSGEAVTQALVGHTGVVVCVAFSADGTRAVSGSLDGTVRLWDARSGEAVSAALPHGQRVTRVAVDAHGLCVVSFAFGGVGKLWDVPRGACVMTSRDAAWESTLDALVLKWSTRDGATTRIAERDAEGCEIVLATPEGEVTHFGDRWCSLQSGFSEFCEVKH